MSLYVNWNGALVKESEVVISPNNRSFRYGEGCFETMKVINNILLLHELHCNRLFTSLNVMHFLPPSFTPALLLQQIIELVNKNGHQKLARVRLVVYRGDGGLYDLTVNTPNYIIQSWPGNEGTNYYNTEGLVVDFFEDAKKTCDNFSWIKSNNYLGYAMAALTAIKYKLDDCLLFNCFNRLSDSTIANVFIVTDDIIKTPSLSEGCIDGVMRRYLLQRLSEEGIDNEETVITKNDLLDATEVFFTNANYGIRWVKKIGDKSFDDRSSRLLHKRFITPLFNNTTF